MTSHKERQGAVPRTAPRPVLGLGPHSVTWGGMVDGVSLEKANNPEERNGQGWEQCARQQDRNAPLVPAAFQKPLGHGPLDHFLKCPCDHGRRGPPESPSARRWQDMGSTSAESPAGTRGEEAGPAPATWLQGVHSALQQSTWKGHQLSKGRREAL